MIIDINDPQYRQCALTVMDNIADPDIRFNEAGICNYYYEYRAAAEKGVITGDTGKKKMEELVNKIKSEGRGKRYDCLIGLSGGVDSTYVALLAKQYGLRPLAIHLDNGWDSELAVKNVENIITRCGFDLFSLVIDWEEFRDIQLAYLQASVVDIEVVSDHAIFASMYKLAKEHNTGYILSGTNIVTEFIMPPSWLYDKMDYANLKDIHSRFGKKRLKTYPYFDFRKSLYYHAVLRLNPVSILNYVPYNKKEVKEIIQKDLGWRDYGGKHYESQFTKFYQAYILPEKFHIDKRKAHLSTLICSGQITKAEAMEELGKPLYEPAQLKADKEYVLKKFGLSADEFEKIMRLPIKKHTAFRSDRKIKERYMNMLIRTAPLRNSIKKLINR